MLNVEENRLEEKLPKMNAQIPYIKTDQLKSGRSLSRVDNRSKWTRRWKWLKLKGPKVGRRTFRSGKYISISKFRTKNSVYFTQMTSQALTFPFYWVVQVHGQLLTPEEFLWSTLFSCDRNSFCDIWPKDSQNPL